MNKEMIKENKESLSQLRKCIYTAFAFAKKLRANKLAGREFAMTVTKLEEALMWANKGETLIVMDQPEVTFIVTNDPPRFHDSATEIDQESDNV